MALLATDQVALVFSTGQCSRTCLFAIKNVDGADTVDLATFFKVVKRAGVVSETGTHIAAVTFTGTIGTIPAGPVDDAMWLLVFGVSV